MLTRPALIVCAAMAPVTALPVFDPYVRRIIELSEVLQNTPLSERARRYADYFRKYALELPLIADDDIQQWACEYHRRLTHIMGMTSIVAGLDRHLDQLTIALEMEAAGMSLVWRVNQRVEQLV